ncbi:hypothetical protein [uncultured Ruminococcus sp.]|uniref:hypothetical protein n=1 Tax=uncultured Ruminococcus sp. TaxID=165186 RepID=UPI0025F4DD76|nr:hypothetical protein [uncultured Ruminococcus sp.]
MSKVLTTCFRFNMDNPEHAKAWDYLHNYDKDKIKSTNVAAITAVNDYFDRMGKLSDDPYFETRQREERFVEQIVSEVGKAFIAEMPKFLASLMLSLNTGYPVQTTPIRAFSVRPMDGRGYAEDGNPSATEGLKTSDEDDYSGIDFDFIGG